MSITSKGAFRPLGSRQSKCTGRVKVLLLLANGPATLADIAAANQIDRPYATVIVDKLEILGLAERTAHPDDFRRKLVQLTEAGRESVERARRIFSEPPAGLAALAPADLGLLDAVLTRLVAPVADAGRERSVTARRTHRRVPVNRPGS